MTAFRDEFVTIHHGDALRILLDLPDVSIDALVTDPPYSSGGMLRGDRMGSPSAKYLQPDSSNQNLAEFSGDNRDQRAYAHWCALWLAECQRIVKPGGVAILFTDWRQLPSTTDALQAGGWVWRGVVPWAKVTYRPQAGRFAAQCEYAVWGSNGPMPVDYSDACLPGFFQAASPREREHITQKPIAVMRELVRIAPVGGTVLDPFMGSGTTGVAAVLEGRKFIGIEMLEHFCSVARSRIEQASGDAVSVGAQGVLL